MTKRSKAGADLFTRMRALDRLTPTEKKIAYFLDSNPKLPAFDNLTALSAKAGVSKASMVRFLIHRLGYEDFAQFKTERQELLERQLESPIKRYLRHKNGGEGEVAPDRPPFHRHFSEVMNHIQAAAAYLRQDTLEQAADRIAQTDRSLFILGQRTSFNLAYLLTTNLHYIRPRVYLMQDGHTSLPTELFNANPGDVAFVISRRRYSRNTHNLTNYMHQQGLSIVLATDSELSPLVSLAEVLLVIPSPENASFESLGAWVAMIESLALMAAERCRHGEKAYAARADEILRQFYGLI